MSSVALFIYWEFVLIICSVIFTCFSIFLFLDYKRKKKWKVVNIEILKVEVQKRNVGGRLHVAYQPFVEYSYIVNGATYKSNNQESSVPFFQSEKLANNYIKVLRSNPQLLAYYDPLDPSNSVLQKGGQIIYSIICIIISMMFILMAYKMFSQQHL